MRYELTVTVSGIENQQKAEEVMLMLACWAEHLLGEFGPAVSMRLSDDQEDAE